MDTRPPLKLDDLRKQRVPIPNINEMYKNKLSPMERFALDVKNKIGSPAFFVLVVVWATTWILWNIFAPAHLKFDSSPEFGVWIFISNIIQLTIMPLILISQNLQEKRSEARADAEFQVNLKSEKEIELILEHLEYQNRMFEEIDKKLKN